MEDIELKRFWEKVKEEILGVLPENAHPWIYPLEVSGYDKGLLTVVTGQMMGRDLLRKNHYNEMVAALKKVSGNENSRLLIIYDEKAAKDLQKENEKIKKKENEAIRKEKAMENLSYMQSASHLNLKYKFENFVVGDNNKFAHAAAMAVAQQPAEKYNPLFIYGASGLGKTHLMQAIGHYILFNNPNLKKVKYTKTEDYIDDFISNTRYSKDTVENMSKFNKKYTNIDIILIDDIQFIESKNKTMASIQRTFDTLYNKGKQIVITSDRMPKEIPTLTKALCSRFEMGLMVELTSPDFTTRLEILKKLVSDHNIEFEEQALEYIAKYFTDNVRELEGAFTKVCAYAEIMNKKITLKLAEDVLKCGSSNEGISYDNIAKVTANYYNVDINDIKGTAKGQNVITARHMAIYLARELTNDSYVNISNYFNKKHTTVLYAYEQVKRKINDTEIKSAIREIKQALNVL